MISEVIKVAPIAVIKGYRRTYKNENEQTLLLERK